MRRWPWRKTFQRQETAHLEEWWGHFKTFQGNASGLHEWAPLKLLSTPPSYFGEGEGVDWREQWRQCRWRSGTGFFRFHGGVFMFTSSYSTKYWTCAMRWLWQRFNSKICTNLQPWRFYCIFSWSAKICALIVASQKLRFSYERPEKGL